MRMWENGTCVLPFAKRRDEIALIVRSMHKAGGSERLASMFFDDRFKKVNACKLSRR